MTMMMMAFTITISRIVMKMCVLNPKLKVNCHSWVRDLVRSSKWKRFFVRLRWE